LLLGHTGLQYEARRACKADRPEVRGELVCDRVRTCCKDLSNRRAEHLFGSILFVRSDVMSNGDLPVQTLGRPCDFKVQPTQARLAKGTIEARLEEVADERVGADDVARVLATPAQEAMPLGILDQGARLVFADPGGDRAELQIDGFQQRGAHQELLELG
jgi:hypothetical protein